MDRHVLEPQLCVVSLPFVMLCAQDALICRGALIVVMMDYLLSNHAATHNAECSEAAWRPLGGGKWNDCTDDGSQDNRYNVFPSVMEFTFNVIDKECGGVLPYLDGIGFGPQRVAVLRRILVESSLPSSHWLVAPSRCVCRKRHPADGSTAGTSRR